MEKLYTVFFWQPKAQSFQVYTKHRTQQEAKSDAASLQTAGITAAVLPEKESGECDPRHSATEKEIHQIHKALTVPGSGWARHPETLRWAGRLSALRSRHDAIVAEMQARGYHGHKTPMVIPVSEDNGLPQERLIQSVESQIEWIKTKNCQCQL